MAYPMLTSPSMKFAPLFALAALTLVSTSADAAVAQGAPERAADPAPSPRCGIGSVSNAWKVPVNAVGVPIVVTEDAGAKLVPSVGVTPTADVSIAADTTSATPTYRRLLKFAGAKVGDVFQVVLGGTCTGAADPTPFTLSVEFVAEAAAPSVLGTLSESPQGTTLLSLDTSFAPYEQLATLTFGINGQILGSYPAGRKAAESNVYGVVACVNGACSTLNTSYNVQNPSSALPLALYRYDIKVCPNGRASGVVEAKVTATAKIEGVAELPAAAAGTIHVDCSKATDAELGIVGGGNPVGCSVAGAARSKTATLTGTALFLLCACASAARRRRRPSA